MKRKEIDLNDKFLVAGAGGMVGSAICRALKKKDMEMKRNIVVKFLKSKK